MAEQRDRDRQDVVIEHPNREKASSKATKAVVVLLLLASAGLAVIIAIGGWKYETGAKSVLLIYAAIYVVLAFFCARWTRGTLPLSAALAIVLLIFAAIAAPQWFQRTQDGFASPALPASLLGLLTAILIPVEFLLIVFAMRGFGQEWNVEVERPADGRRGHGEPEPAAA